MSTIKITQLPAFTSINANTQNTIFVGVDIPSAQTFQFTAKTLARGLYLNESLDVGGNPNILPNTIAQFALSGNSYIQTNLVNTNDGGTADIVVTANSGSGGTDSAYFIDVGFANKNVQPGLEFNNLGTALYPLDGYLYVQGGSVGVPSTANGGNLIIGATTTNTQIKFIAGGYNSGNIIATITADGLKMINNRQIFFTDGTSQNSAPANIAYSIASFAQANTASNNITILQGVNTTQNTWIASNAAFSQAAFTQANTANSNVIVVQGANDTQNTWIASNAAFSQAAFTQANTASANTIVTQGIDNTQNTNIQSAWNTANTALQNTSSITVNNSIVVPGNLVVSNTITVSGNVNIQAQVQSSANNPALRISGAVNYSSATPLNSGYMIQVTGYANTVSRIVNDAFGANTYAAYIGRSSRGNATFQTATQNNDVILRIAGNGYANSFSQFGQSRIDIVAEENFTDTTKGTRIDFWNTPTGSNIITKIATFNANSVIFTGAVLPQKGFIWNPNTYPGAQTAITLDFANNSVLRTQTTTGLTVSFTNYTVGKVVDMWITNTAGTNQTFTHGCSALNSTTNSTTYNIPGTSTIYAKYISFGTDLANTYVAITHA